MLVDTAANLTDKDYTIIPKNFIDVLLFIEIDA